MTPTLSQIWRHPIKAIGRERQHGVTLVPGRILPGDRCWAATHEKTRDAGPGWAKKANFLRGVSGPNLMAVTAETDGEKLVLRHPERPDLIFAPGRDDRDFLDWIRPLWPADLPQPTGLVRCDTGFTDVSEPWISVHGLATHREIEREAGRDLSIHRWRGNLWLDGLAPWAEFDLIGRTFRIGDAVLRGMQRITRCRATEANPDTGIRDVDTLGTLRTWNHQDFGIYAEVITGGTIRPGAEVMP